MEFSEDNKLYRFFTPNLLTIQSIANSELWFSNRDNFNDPFEGKVDFRFQEFDPKNEPLYLHVAKKLIAFSEQSDFSKITSIEELSVEEVYARLKLHCEELFSTLIRSISDEEAIACFCQNSGIAQAQGNLSMWSHYGAGLTGFCVEFDSIKLISSLEDLNQSTSGNSLFVTPWVVEYQTNFPKIEPLAFLLDWLSFVVDRDSYTRERLAKPLTSIKPEKFIEESEVRFVASKALNTGQQGRLMKFDMKSIISVTFGEKMPAQTRKTLEMMFNNQGVDNFYTLKCSSTEYQFQLITG